MVDLHTHSTASDGTYSPTELVKKAHETGISVLALTDHDTVAGLAEACEAGKRYGVHIIPGIEISIAWQPGEFHLLGLGLTPDHPMLQAMVEDVRRKRKERNAKIIEQFNQAGIVIDPEKLAAIAGNGVIGRPHFAQYLVAEKKAKNIPDAFQKYLAKGRPFYKEKECVPFEQAIAVIKAAQGVPVIAHPMSLYLSWSKLPDAIARFQAQGLVGLEAWHPTARYNDCKRLHALAEKLGLIITAGSDFHGENRKDRYLGKTVRNIPIDDSFYTEQLVPALAAVRADNI